MKLFPRSREGTNTPARHSVRGVTLMELLCVLAILAVIASLYLPAIARAYSKVKQMFGSE